MSILEKFLKNKKGGLVVQDESQNLSDRAKVPHDDGIDSLATGTADRGSAS